MFYDVTVLSHISPHLGNIDLEIPHLKWKRDKELSIFHFVSNTNITYILRTDKISDNIVLL